MSDFHQNIAVVIGINDYQNGISTLNSAVHDAEVIADILEENHNYNPVRRLLNEEATKAGIEACLNEIPHLVGKEDRLLFYFAGHGIASSDEDKPSGFLIPQDGHREKECSYVSMQRVHDALIALPCRHVLVILDCCFAGAFQWTTSTREISTRPERLYRERYLRYIADPAWQIITSASYDQKAQDLLADWHRTGSRGDEKLNGKIVSHSPFAEALIKVLRDGEGDHYGYGIITANQLYSHLRERIEDSNSDNLHKRQTPEIWHFRKHGKGEYIFRFPSKKGEPPTAPQLFASNNPYLGLKSFDEERAKYFFGRQTLTQNLLETVETNSLTNVIGISGSGKSSLVMAGLIPQIRKRYPRSWHLLPTIRPGEKPVESLCELFLFHDLNHYAWENEACRSCFHNSALNRLEQWFHEYPRSRLVLVIDQLEELISLCNDQVQRKIFLKLITDALQTHPEHLRVITTLRSDFEPQIRKLAFEIAEELGVSAIDEKLNRFLVKPMTHNELREIIEEPASVQTLFFESPQFVDDLISEVVDMPGALPLLSFTLSELYLKYLEFPGDRTLRRSHYDELGGINGALGHRADELIPKDAEKLEAMMNIMLRMVSVEGGELTRRRVYKRELTFPNLDSKGNSTDEGTNENNRENNHESGSKLNNDTNKYGTTDVFIDESKDEDSIKKSHVEELLKKLEDARLIVSGNPKVDEKVSRAEEQGSQKIVDDAEAASEDADIPSESVNQELTTDLVVSGRTTDDEDSKKSDLFSYYEPAHDALIRSWPALTTWIDEEQRREDDLTYQRRLWRATDEWQAKLDDHPPETVWDIIRDIAMDQAAQFIPLPLPEKESLLWDDDTRSAQLEKVLAGKRHWLNAMEMEFAEKSTEQGKINRRVRRRVRQLLLTLLVLAMVAAFIANDQRRVSVANLWGKLENESQRFANVLIQQLTEDPIASLHMGILALPSEGNARPYNPKAEAGLDQAIRTTAERQYYHLSNEPLLSTNVASGTNQIAIGGTGLALVDFGLTEAITLTEHPTKTFKVQWIDDDTLLGWSDQEVQVWQDQSMLSSWHFSPQRKIACAKPRPQSEEIAICQGKIISIWTPSQKTLISLTHLPGRVIDGRWTRNGERLALWDEGNAFAVWDFTLGRLVDLPAPEAPSHVWELAWVDDGRYLAVVTNGGYALVSDMNDPNQVMQLPIDKGTSGVQPQSGDQFFTWTVNGRAWLWSASQDTPLFEYSSLTDAPLAALFFFQEEDAMLMALGDGSAQFYASTIITDSVTLSGHMGKVLAADLRGEYIATASADGSVRVWNKANGFELMALEGHTSLNFYERANVWDVHWLDDQHLLTHGEDGTVRRWQVFDDWGEPLCRGYTLGTPRCFDPNSTYRGHTGNIETIRWVDDETFLTTSRDSTARRWKLGINASEILTHPFGTTIQWDPSGTYVLSFTEEAYLSEGQNSDGKVRRFDTKGEVASIPGRIARAFWLNSGILTVNLSNTVQLVDPLNGKVKRELPGYTAQVTAVAERANGSIATGEANGTIRIWNSQEVAESTMITGTLLIEKQYVINSIEWSQDGQRLLTAGRYVTLWDLQNQTPVWGPIDTGFDNAQAAFSPDEQTIAYKAGKTVHVVNVADGSIEWSDETSHDQPIRGIEWVTSRPWQHQYATWLDPGYWRNRLFPMEKVRYLLLTWSDDDTARLWDWEEGKEVMRMTELGDVSVAAINPRGDTIVTATILFERGPEGLIHTWRSWHNDHNGLLAAACEMRTRHLSDAQRSNLLGESAPAEEFDAMMDRYCHTEVSLQ